MDDGRCLCSDSRYPGLHSFPRKLPDALNASNAGSAPPEELRIYSLLFRPTAALLRWRRPQTEKHNSGSGRSIPHRRNRCLARKARRIHFGLLTAAISASSRRASSRRFWPAEVPRNLSVTRRAGEARRGIEKMPSSFRADDGGGFRDSVESPNGGTSTLEYKSPQGISRFPLFLPDGHHFLYVVTRAAPEENGIYFRSADGKENRRILPDESSVWFVAGRLLFIRENTLIAQPFDPDAGKTAGDPVQIAPGVSTTSNVIYAPSVTASEKRHADLPRAAVRPVGTTNWFGLIVPASAVIHWVPPAPCSSRLISPDGKSVAFGRITAAGSDLWDLGSRSVDRTALYHRSRVRTLSGVVAESGSYSVSVQPRGGIYNIYQQAVGGTGGGMIRCLSDQPAKSLRNGTRDVSSWSTKSTRKPKKTSGLSRWKWQTRTSLCAPHSEFTEDQG